MAIVQLPRLGWAAFSLTCRPTTRLAPTVLCPALADGRRHASVKAQGAYKLKPKRTHPKKYGAKRSGDQYVVPGNIIFKQKGTLWWPGENCIMGRDHTIHAAASGYVKYYRDPHKHPDRKYIGVVFDQKDTLPYPLHAVRKRRLNMEPVPRREDPNAMWEPMKKGSTGSPGESHIPVAVSQRVSGSPNPRILHLQDDYSYRESNWELGKLLGDVSAMRMKGPKSRRAALFMRRVKQENRHKRLRTWARTVARNHKRDMHRLKVNRRNKRTRMIKKVKAFKANMERVKAGASWEAIMHPNGRKERKPQPKKQVKVKAKAMRGGPRQKGGKRRKR